MIAFSATSWRFSLSAIGTTPVSAALLRPQGLRSIDADQMADLRNPACQIEMILRARLDPVPLPAPHLALPEPGVGLEMVHREVGRLEGVATVPRGRGDEHYGIARAHP